MTISSDGDIEDWKEGAYIAARHGYTFTGFPDDSAMVETFREIADEQCGISHLPLVYIYKKNTATRSSKKAMSHYTFRQTKNKEKALECGGHRLRTDKFNDTKLAKKGVYDDHLKWCEQQAI